MKVINNAANDNDRRPLSGAERDALSRFEASDRQGVALFRPRVAGDRLAPDCAVCVEEEGRFVVSFLTGRYSVENGKWHRHDGDGDAVFVSDPMEQLWQAAMAVKDAATRDFDFGCFIVPVAVFVDMEANQEIMAAKQLRAVKILWGTDDLVERIIAQLPEDKRQTGLNARFIEKDVRALSRVPSPSDETAPASEDLSVDLGAGQLTMNGVETAIIHVHVYLTGHTVRGDEASLVAVTRR